jgi:5-methylcytosine-specific restriction endonuclease McrA
MGQSRSSKGVLHPPRVEPTHSAEARQKWLAKASSGYVQPSRANHAYYDEILRMLWPEAHGLPGPHVDENQIRAAIDRLRIGEGKEPYRDPFRRMRELQGDEGFKSIVKQGKAYQLQSLEVSTKREPRTKPPAALWKNIRKSYGFRCAKCGQTEPEVHLSPDHRVPRSRGGTGDDLNWQPLCQRCNIVKSAACQDCTRLCQTCFWAYPESYVDLDVSDTFRAKIKDDAARLGVSQNEILERIIREYFQR